MKKRLYILMVSILIFSFRVSAQPPETIYLGNLVYAGYVNDAAYGPYNIGFNFTFFGNTYSQFYVSSNGLVTFGAGSADGTNDPIPSAVAPNNFIAPFWDDLTISFTGKVLYTTIGVAPNRKLVIQFVNMNFYNIPASFGTFSVILYETTNAIQVQFRLIMNYLSTRSHGGTSTIGIENSTGTAGIQYSYQNPVAISNEQAISFSPSGPTYTVNPNAVYDGVYLTTNISLPEPGITTLISPAQNAVIGANQTFEWAAASNAASYKLYISHSSDLTDATTYNAGLNLSYNITGLLLDTTYYWGVFATNATGTTWCEIKKFTTTSAPPLVPVPQTIWSEQGFDKTIKLNYTGGDVSPKTAIITSLPAQGQLYQYNAGVRGALISSTGTTVTDAAMNVIYAASGGTGNGVGNFKFKINDAGGDSPEATIAVNVSPPGIPDVLYVAKNTNVEIQFDRLMNDPTGKQLQFTVKVNSVPATINSVSLKPGDNYSFILTLATPLTGTETVLVSYTQGTVTSVAGGFLLSFTDEPVTLLAQTITFAQSLSKKYSDSPFALTSTASSGLGLTYSSSNLSVATIAGSTLTIHALGSSDITARQAGNATYAPAKYLKTLTVAKGDQTIAFSVLPVKTYGDGDFAVTATSSSGLSVSFAGDNPAVATVVGNTVHIVGAGTAVITASQGGNALWNPAPDVPRTLTVNKASQTISFSVLPVKVYGDIDFAPVVSASSGLSVGLASDNPSVATIIGGNIHIVGAGTAGITASQPGDANWLPAADVPQTLTVNKANQTITFSVLPTKTYGDVDFPLTATSSSGLSVGLASDNPAVATIVSGNIHITGGGTAVITASQPGDGNYNPAPDVPRTLTVNKVNLTFTAENKTKEFQQANPPLTYLISGFVNSEDQSVVDALPSIQTTALLNSPPGDYPITLTGGNDNSYNYLYVAGTLTVTKLLQTITFTTFPAEKLLAGGTFSLAATSTSGLTVLFESTDSEIATVSGNQLTAVSKGKARIRAYNTGDVNYEPAELFDTVEVYSTHKDIMYLFTPNGDGINDYWELPELATWGKCDVKLYNRWGKLVFADANYNNLWNGTSNGNPVPEGAYYFVIKSVNAGVIKGTLNIVR